MTLVNNVIAGRDQRIADLAYRMWEEDGRPEGRAEAHWLRAAVLVDEMAPKAPAKKKAAAHKNSQEEIIFPFILPETYGRPAYAHGGYFLMCVPLPPDDK